MVSKQFRNLSAKACIEMIASYKRNMAEARMFHAQELEKEIKHYRDGIEELSIILWTKYKTKIK
tara:strand:+ start:526 stop:717 length:192 start_codon:yes stop_codon:yes gene_type:complete